MLDAIRRYSSSIVVKALMALLILSFAAWGVGDVIRTGAAPTGVAEVGGVEISPVAMANELQREVGQLRAIFGERFTLEQARSMGIADAVLARLIDEALTDLAAKDLGVAISDDLVRRKIQGYSAFQGVVGGFDRSRFQLALQNLGMTEAQFINRVRTDTARQQLIDSLGAGAVPAPPVVEAVYRRRQERRVADIALVADAAMTGIGEPDAATLAAYHRDYAASFTAPEYRTLTVLRLEADDLAKEIAVPEAEIKEAYEARIDDFRRPERRRLQQFVLAGEAAALAAHARLQAGEDYARVAKEAAGAETDQLEIGLFTRDQLLPELAEAAFALAEGGVSAPLRSPLGWHLLRVAGIEAAQQRSLAEAREDVRKELATEKAVESLYKLATRLEDALGGGASIPEAAQKLALSAVRIGPIDGQGKDANGVPTPDLPSRFLETAFATAKGADSGLVDAGGTGYFVLRVDEVTPAAVRSLASVRAEVAAAWTAARRSEAAKKAAEALAERLNEGADLGVLAREMNLVVATQRLQRAPERTAGRPPEALVAQVFGAGLGKAVTARGANGYFVALLKEVIAADPAAEADGMKALDRQLQQAMQADLRAQLAAALRQRYAVTINRRNFEKLF